MNPLSAFIAGVMFAAGLCISGMTRPEKVLGFLDVTGAWDPSLMFVMAGAIGVHLTMRKLLAGRPKPLFAASFATPPKKEIDRRLVLGAALFGVGWGLTGICPGPALVSLTTGARPLFAFVAAMVLGMALFNIYRRAEARQHAALKRSAAEESPRPAAERP
jgi:uncharacterized membrane protein YedE/YeeE